MNTHNCTTMHITTYNCASLNMNTHDCTQLYNTLHLTAQDFKQLHIAELDYTCDAMSCCVMSGVSHCRCGRGLQTRLASVMSSPSSLVARQTYLVGSWLESFQILHITGQDVW